MTDVTVYGGASEIGGNKILLDDHTTRFFLDFGKNYATERWNTTKPKTSYM